MKKNDFNLKVSKKVTWKRAFSNAVDELKDELYNQCSKVYSVNESMFSEIYENVAQNYNITTIKLESVLERMGFPKNWKDITNIERSVDN